MKSVFAGATLLALTFAHRAEACAVCFGPSDELTIKAVSNSILFMIGTTTFVLGGLTYMVVTIIRKVRRLEHLRAASDTPQS